MKLDLSIGKLIVSLIKSSVTSLTTFSVCLAEPETKFPFATYRRTSAEPLNSKDLTSGINTATYDLNIVSDKYDEGLTITQQVIDALSHKRFSSGNLHIIDITVTAGAEDAINDAYVQNLSITIKYQ